MFVVAQCVRKRPLSSLTQLKRAALPFFTGLDYSSNAHSHIRHCCRAFTSVPPPASKTADTGRGAEKKNADSFQTDEPRQLIYSSNTKVYKYGGYFCVVHCIYWVCYNHNAAGDLGRGLLVTEIAGYPITLLAGYFGFGASLLMLLVVKFLASKNLQVLSYIGRGNALEMFCFNPLGFGAAEKRVVPIANIDRVTKAKNGPGYNLRIKGDKLSVIMDDTSTGVYHNIPLLEHLLSSKIPGGSTTRIATVSEPEPRSYIARDQEKAALQRRRKRR